MKKHKIKGAHVPSPYACDYLAYCYACGCRILGTFICVGKKVKLCLLCGERIGDIAASHDNEIRR